MRNVIVLCVAFLWIATATFAQVGINADNSAPDNSAMLDVKASNKGMLVPRMTATERDLISKPAKGLLIFCTTDNQYYFNLSGILSVPNWQKLNSQWVNVGPNIYYDLGSVGIGEPNPSYPLNFSSDLGDKISLYGTAANHYGFGIQGNQLQIHGDESASDILFGYGSSAAFTERMRIKGNGQVGIGTTLPSSSALVELTSVNLGFLPPRMTMAQINAIATPAEGLTVYNTTIHKMVFFDGIGWQSTDGFHVGDYYGGGIIFYIDGTDQHGLIAALSDQSTAAQWGCSGALIGDVIGTAVGTGQANTTAIVNGCSEAGIAARICNDLVINGYYDWFLPSKDELNLLYQQRFVVGGFTGNYYWSSSEYNASYAWNQRFYLGTQSSYIKHLTNDVRAVRAF